MANRRNYKGSGAKNSKRKVDVKATPEGSTKYIVVGILMVVIASALIAFVLFGGDSQEAFTDSNTNEQGNILIPLADVGTRASYFQQNIDGVTIKYFTLKGSDGQIHTAFDACDVCYREKKGYEQQGDDMVCRNCGNKYASNGIGTENQGGGCWPGYLETSTASSNLVITKASLARGKYYFS